MLNDLFGYFKRNIHNMKPYEQKKMRKELESIMAMLDREIKRANKSA